MSVKELKKELTRIYEELEHLLVFTYQMDVRQRAELEALKRRADRSTAKWLRQERDHQKENIHELRKLSGCKVSAAELSSLYEDLYARPGHQLELPKWMIDKELFRNYAAVHPAWKLYPPHAFVPFDPSGESCGRNLYQYHLPEAVLYEDMCIAYNLSISPAVDLKIPRVKTTGCMQRCATLSAFYFVESFLNGIAFDFFICNEGTISPEDTEALLEWDATKNRERWLNFRDKILKYPRIILGLKHPPLTEQNCDELKLLLGTGKDIRDALVHQSPKIAPLSGEMQKTKLLIELNHEEVTGIVDASIGFVRKLNDALGPSGQDLSWLFSRDELGVFPEKSFA